MGVEVIGNEVAFGMNVSIIYIMRELIKQLDIRVL